MSTRARKPTWQADLAALLCARLDAPFAWGHNDCCLFAADCVQAQTGVDPAAGLRGYGDARQALQLAADMGGLRQHASALLGPEVSPLQARMGDVLLVLDEGREIMALCNGATALAPGKSGLVTLPISAALAAWRVGDV